MTSQIPTMQNSSDRTGGRLRAGTNATSVPGLDYILNTIKAVASEAGRQILLRGRTRKWRYRFSAELPGEIKAEADLILERQILRRLLPLGFPILSEESGYIPGRTAGHRFFVVDPLDGTYNLLRNLGPAAVSVAFWDGCLPLAGAVYDLAQRRLYWGGPGLGAWCDDTSLAVSTITNPVEAALCTGYPVRLRKGSRHEVAAYRKLVAPFGKVRMIGSAAMSLIRVAEGSAEAYAERHIMLWDVAAGLAIVRGAGGQAWAMPLGADWSCIAVASNGRVNVAGLVKAE